MSIPNKPNEIKKQMQKLVDENKILKEIIRANNELLDILEQKLQVAEATT